MPGALVLPHPRAPQPLAFLEKIKSRDIPLIRLTTHDQARHLPQPCRRLAPPTGGIRHKRLDSLRPPKREAVDETRPGGKTEEQHLVRRHSSPFPHILQRLLHHLPAAALDSNTPCPHCSPCLPRWDASARAALNHSSSQTPSIWHPASARLCHRAGHQDQHLPCRPWLPPLAMIGMEHPYRGLKPPTDSSLRIVRSKET